MSGAATIFDVADLASVSIKTVSRVVNNELNVSDKTREKVLEAVEKLNYQPNTAARGLSGKRSYTLGLIYEEPEEFSYLGALLSGAHRGCEEMGYALLLRPLSLPNESVEGSIRQFVNQTRVDGILLPPPLADIPAVLELLRELQLPFAAITPKVRTEGAISIHCHDESAIFDLTSFVIEQGHEDIGFIKGPSDHVASINRFAGYRRALKTHDITYNGSLVRQGFFDFESGKAAASKLFDLDKPPTAIVASNDDMAVGVIFEARERGLSVPEDFSVVGFDDTKLAAHSWPPLTTVHQPIEEMADLAAHLLIKQISGDTSNVAVEPFKCELIIRNSSSRR